MEKQSTEIFVDGVHEYSYSKHTDDNGKIVHELKYSDNPIWSVHIRGTLGLKVIDDGNGFRIWSDSGIKQKIDYSDAYRLRIMMNFITQDYGKVEFYKKIEQP